MARPDAPARYNPFNLPAAFLPPGSDAGGFDAHASAARAYAGALAAFLREHGWVLEAHPVQFLTRQPLRRLPPAWQAELATAGAHAWLAPPPDAAPPDGSLAAWFARAAALAMPREPPPEGREAAHCFDGDAQPQPQPQPLRRGAGLEALHTCAKKAHELSRFAAFVAALAARCGSCDVVDAGAGAGRLGGALAARFGLRVLGLERDADAVERAARRRAWLDADAARRGVADAAAQRCVTLQADVDAAAAPLSTSGSAVLTGLHACGELTVDVLRQFTTQRSRYAAVAVAGCCYQHAASFPASAACAAACGSAEAAAALLPRRAREAAAQSAGAAFLSRQPPHRRAALRRRALARALLELIHEERCLPSDAAALGDSGGLSGKHPYDGKTAFSAYAAAALGLEGGWPAGEAAAVDARFADVAAAQDAGLAALTAMRCAAGAVAEALLVLDRALMLAEALNTDDVAMGVVPLFDPALSPRNLVVWARRLRPEAGVENNERAGSTE